METATSIVSILLIGYLVTDLQTFKKDVKQLLIDVAALKEHIEKKE